MDGLMSDTRVDEIVVTVTIKALVTESPSVTAMADEIEKTGKKNDTELNDQIAGLIPR